MILFHEGFFLKYKKKLRIKKSRRMVAYKARRIFLNIFNDGAVFLFIFQTVP